MSLRQTQRDVELARRGIETRVFATAAHPDQASPRRTTEEVQVCRDHDALGRALGEYAPDWTLTLFVPDLAADLRAARAGAPNSRVLVECQMSDPANLSALLEPEILAHVDAMIVPSPSTAAFMRDVLPVPIPIGIVPNAVPDNFARPTRSDVTGDPILLWVGRFEPVKNWPMLIDIAERVLRRRRVQVWVVGGGHSDPRRQSQFIRAVERRGIAAALHWRDRVSHDDMPDVYAAVASSGGCLLSTSYSECQSHSILEAMAARCPVVASEVRGVIDDVRHGETGWLFPVNDASVAADRVLDVLEGFLDRASVVERAARYVERFTIEASLDQLLALLRDPNGFRWEPETLATPRDRMLQPTRAQLVATGRTLLESMRETQDLLREVARRDETIAWLHREVAERDAIIARLQAGPGQTTAEAPD
ncbi:MAG: glycosyltransferase [Chloroflexota bacterium]